jgi:hypothetical protein
MKPCLCELYPRAAIAHDAHLALRRWVRPFGYPPGLPTNEQRCRIRLGKHPTPDAEPFHFRAVLPKLVPRSIAQRRVAFSVQRLRPVQHTGRHPSATERRESRAFGRPTHGIGRGATRYGAPRDRAVRHHPIVSEARSGRFHSPMRERPAQRGDAQRAATELGEDSVRSGTHAPRAVAIASDPQKTTASTTIAAKSSPRYCIE